MKRWVALLFVATAAHAGDPAWVGNLPSTCTDQLDNVFNDFFFHDPGRTKKKITYSNLHADHLDRDKRDYPVSCLQGKDADALYVKGACYADGHTRPKDASSSLLQDAQFLEITPDGNQLHFMPGEQAYCKKLGENYLEIAVGFKDNAHRQLVAHAEGCHFKYVAKFASEHPQLKELARGYAPLKAINPHPSELAAVDLPPGQKFDPVGDDMQLLPVFAKIESETSREIEISRDPDPKGTGELCHLRALKIGLTNAVDGGQPKDLFQTMDAAHCTSLPDRAKEKDGDMRAVLDKASLYCDVAKDELFKSLAFDSDLAAKKPAGGSGAGSSGTAVAPIGR